VNTCYITVPNAFTPNNDGKNDHLYPLNAYKAVNLEFNIFNRYGQLIFHTTDWTRHWDGTVNGLLQATGVYVWTLRYSDRDTGQKIFKRGTTVLIR
jgi:gliding motility-associated-like protein